MQTTIAFDPLLPWPLIALAAGLAVFSVGAAMWRGLAGWWLRALALGVLIAALTGPQLKREEREGLGNVGFLVVDRSESTTLEDRGDQIAAAVARLTSDAEALAERGGGLDLRVVEVGPDGTGRNRGTRLLSALDEAAARVSADRIAGAVLVTDGQVHDEGRLDAFPAPVHALIAGGRDGFDLRLELTNGPAFGIVGESVTFRLRAVALGERPAGLGSAVTAQVSVDGGPARPLRMMLGEETEVEIAIEHGGPTVVDIQLPVLTEELTDRNNRLIATVSGVRDRLRVLLVSGEPHPGGRTWRDLLKSDPTVDLIHFTILRPPAKQDGTPVSELSLIAFPTRELFLEKISNFDLIVFDRYRWRGVLASAYLANIARYVREGGAVMVSSGAAFSGPQSLARTPLGEVLPADPTMEVFERPFLPRVSALGQRHPVTAGLEAAAGLAEDGDPRWGRWLRHVDVAQSRGDAVMEGVEGRPLLILDRVGEGRVALLASDHAWLWSRGYEGGGPQADLLRRTAHWLMREPELEEEALFARTEGTRILIERRTLAETPPETVQAVTPSGAPAEITLRPAGPGRWRAAVEDAEEGLWRFTDGTRRAVAAVGPPSPKEYEMPLATDALLEPLAEATGGSVRWLADGVPELRLVAEGRRAQGRSWVGMTDRDAYRVSGVRLSPLLPVWLAALMTGLLFLGAWRREGR
ncbi:hypothetical protein M1105_03380 [Limibaculum sp. FT325]|uniref:hypothetical protein n=1 Tax=Thermohalobaculum sediminis TaxID=2939436 RepID=UPI0020BF4A6B|nr:hypothetical protein [Limibaculum sediminis]MCL5776041.1 hypothetical protein [Limibaculum sediminis]